MSFPTGTFLSDNQLRAEIGTMLMGGFETTAHTLGFTLMCLSTNPQAEAAVVSELEGLGLLAGPGKVPRDLQFDDLKNMPEISNVIKEAMRLHPVVAGVPRYQLMPFLSTACTCGETLHVQAVHLKIPKVNPANSLQIDLLLGIEYQE